MGGDDPDDRVTNLAAGAKVKPLLRRSIVARVGFMRQAQVSAQNFNADLPTLRPVVRQPRHGVHPSQPDGRWLVTTQLVRSRGEPFVQRSSALLGQRATSNAPGRPEADKRHQDSAAKTDEAHHGGDERGL
jgi:hypothetical protein